MDPFAPLDAVITGWAYDYATTALGVIEGSSRSDAKISTQMLCTLDNLIRTVLFSDKIFVTQEPSLGYPEDAHFGASPGAKSLLEKERIFLPLERRKDKDAFAQSVSRAAQTLKPIEIKQSSFCVIRYGEEGGSWVFSQETLVHDAFLIEDAISQAGLQRFKPLFPGDALYLGVRESMMPSRGPTENITDIAARKMKSIVKARMARLNETVELGSLPLPTLPPLFVNRILHDCSSGADVIPAILEARNSSAARRFRTWASQCMEWIASEDIGERMKAAEAYESLVNFAPKPALSHAEWSKGALSIGTAALDAVGGSPSGAISAVGSAIINYVVGLPLSLLDELGQRGEGMHSFLQKNFGDTFNRVDMRSISNQLDFPDTALAWKRAQSRFEVKSGRVDSGVGPFARPYLMRTHDSHEVQGAAKQFEDDWKKAGGQSLP